MHTEGKSLDYYNGQQNSIVSVNKENLLKCFENIIDLFYVDHFYKNRVEKGVYWN